MAVFMATVRDSRVLELPAEAEALHLIAGQQIEIDLPSAEPNWAGLAMLDDLEIIKKGMRKTDGSNTEAMIREGRSGAMYGL